MSEGPTAMVGCSSLVRVFKIIRRKYFVNLAASTKLFFEQNSDRNRAKINLGSTCPYPKYPTTRLVRINA